MLFVLFAGTTRSPLHLSTPFFRCFPFLSLFLMEFLIHISNDFLLQIFTFGFVRKDLIYAVDLSFNVLVSHDDLLSFQVCSVCFALFAFFALFGDRSSPLLFGELFFSFVVWWSSSLSSRRSLSWAHQITLSRSLPRTPILRSFSSWGASFLFSVASSLFDLCLISVSSQSSCELHLSWWRRHLHSHRLRGLPRHSLPSDPTWMATRPAPPLVYCMLLIKAFSMKSLILVHNCIIAF